MITIKNFTFRLFWRYCIQKMVERINELKKICQGSYVEKESRMDKIFYRRLSIYITRCLLILFPKITPNQVTSSGIIIGIIGVILIAVYNLYSNLLGFLLLYIWTLLDRVDGEIARYKKTKSLKGLYLDELSHFIITPAFFMAISFRIFSELSTPLIFLVGFLAALSTLLIRIDVKMPFQIFSQKAITSHKFLLDEYTKKDEISTIKKPRFGVISSTIYILYKDFTRIIIFFIAYLADSSKSLQVIFDINYKLIILSLYTIFLVSIFIWRINIACRNENFSNKVNKVYYKIKEAL